MAHEPDCASLADRPGHCDCGEQMMFAAFYGSRAQIEALAQAPVPGDSKVKLLVAAEHVRPGEFAFREKAELLGKAAGLAVHRAVKANG